MASRRLKILLIAVVFGVVLVLVEADRHRRDDSSGGSGSSSEQPMRRPTRLPNRRTPNGNRNGNPNGSRRTGPGATNQRNDGRSNSGQSQGTSVRKNNRQTPTKKQGPKGASRVPGSIQKTNSVSSPTLQRQPTNRRNLPMKNSNNNVAGSEEKNTPAKPKVNTNNQIPRRKNNKRSSESSSSVSSCCSSRGSEGSEPTPPIAPSAKTPVVDDPRASSGKASQETQTSRNEAAENDISKEEDPEKDVSNEDETYTEKMDGDRKGEDEENADDVTTFEGSAAYTIPSEIATFTIVTEFITFNNTDTETTTPINRDVPTPVLVRRKRSLVFCEADRPKSFSKCPCPEEITLPVLPQFPVTECKFRKANDIEIPIGIKANETNGSNTSSHSLVALFTTIVVLLIVYFAA